MSISKKVAVLMTVLLMVPMSSVIGAYLDDFQADLAGRSASGRGTGSRAGENVTISGWIRDAGDAPPAWAIVVAANLSSYSIENWTISSDGNYSFNVSGNASYLVMMVPFSGEELDGFDLHGFFPISRFIDVEEADIEQNYTITPAYELILKGYGPDRTIVDNGNFTGNGWSTRFDDKAAFSVWSEVDDGTGMKLPSILIPLEETRDLWFHWETGGYGRSVVRIDNEGNGFRSDVQGAEIVDVNFELAHTQLDRMAKLFSKYSMQNYEISDTTKAHTTSATSACEDAQGQTGNQRLGSLEVCLAQSLLGIEGMERDRALVDIEDFRKGDVLVKVTDSNGLPVENVSIEYEQTSRDFLFGVFGPMEHVGLETYQMLRDIGVNYATMGFYWHVTEPTEGDIIYDDINSTWGIDDLAAMGYTLKAHALIYLMDLVMPEYMKAKTFAELKVEIYGHVYNLVDTYKDKIDIWNVVNEANGKHASLGLNRSQVTELIKVGSQAIRDADPDGEIIVNNGFDWFGQSITPGYQIENLDNFTLPVHQYMDLLEDEGVDYDIVGQQMYDGGWSDFFVDAGLSPVGMPVITFDLGFISYVFDELHRYDKPIHMTELSVSGEWNDTWEDAGYWRAKWNETVQAEFLREFYTIAFSKRNVEAITWWDIDDGSCFLNKGALFDEGLQPKEAFYALKDLLENWTTVENGTTDENGELHLRGFGGDYNISVRFQDTTRYIDLHITEQEVQELNITLEDFALRPDLRLNDWEVMVKTKDFLDTGLVEINVTINNEGERNATGVRVRFFEGTLDNGTVIGDDVVVPVVDVGDMIRVDTKWNASGRYGTYNVSVIVDPDDDIAELNESNNQVEKKVVLPLPLHGWLRVEVLENGTNATLRNATVTVLDINDTTRGRGRTDGQGLFTVDEIGIGCYRVEVELKNYLKDNSSVCIDKAETVEVVFRLDRITTGNIIGTVFDKMGVKVLEGATVVLIGLNLSSTTNLGGGYGFFGLQQGDYGLEASSEGFVTANRTVTVIANSSVNLDFHLERDRGSIVGNVTNNVTGEAIPDAMLMLEDLTARMTDLQGGYRFDDVPTGGHVISVAAEGFYSTGVDVRVFANSTTYMDVRLDPIVAPVDPNGTISGTVRDSKSKGPIVRATVTLKELDVIILTDSKGTFEFDAVPPGNYTIVVLAKDYVNKEVKVTLGHQGNETVEVLLKAETKVTTTDLLGLALMTVVFLITFIIVSYLIWRKLRRVFRGKEDKEGLDEEEDEERTVGEDGEE